ncbi:MULTISPECIES: 4Fe-4S dicluster domain-containing protein [Carboxydocella]|uniref:Ferredoxin n=2 Tax=Carboxydocella TaxID=178898 RepID=A0A1T4NQT6_9FIRM|nr:MULTISPECIES: 4Fe-4S dicluster domain-containing protein [Carboxydocella]AVX20225.1 Fe-S-cluster-containing dehydrogenase component [Carboxydocella thermautotrophica]AVX30643.1 Fe-S-cluster-containing dehydrogenase component [Carboxydocella thermautotrophica]SJZ81620.1 Fe-S-cluster-containing dehydrogenase component [Carboxydocella sporoproducens DSM 16521]GAW28362.1 4Fe-4S ferredoxin [Carboxydocella sp. ULO1]GAW31059.1 4Fe-4S ferredoxin [Carboxydocella sp. JDF658]
MARYGMLIDTRKCVACFSCKVGCQMQNELEPGQAFTRLEQRESGVYPDVRVENVFIQCQHCEDAPCVKVCPTTASYRRPDGVVLVDPDKCIGCKYCMVACPYQARIQDEKTGVVEKCRFCIELVEAGGEPHCVTSCITGCRIFGDLDDPKSEINKEIIKRGAKPLRPDLCTKAKIFYVR